jgi:predicted dehydrogenase
MKTEKIPRILLVGVGYFGKNHLRVLRSLEKKGKAVVVGAVTATKTSKENVEKEFQVPVSTKISDDILKKVDGVDIVTPYESHYEIAKKCLAHTNVIVEKPMAATSEQSDDLVSYAKKHNRVLMAAHVFRFHRVVEKIKELTGKEKPFTVKGSFINTSESDKGMDIFLEIPHYFDIMDYLFSQFPESTFTQKNKRLNTVSLRYPNKIDAIFTLGWSGNEKIRTLDFYFSNKTMKCDFAKNEIKIIEENSEKKIAVKKDKEPLEEELSTFLDVLKGKERVYPDGEVGSRIVRIAEMARPKVKERVKVAIIGSGIFGANCAIALDKFCDVEVFEKNNDIMMEASFVNQYRHHWGYHYPRSVDTVKDIRKAIPSFEALYNDAIIRNFPTYYAVAKEGSKTTPEDYLKFCRDNNLPFTEEFPDSKFLNRDKIAACIKTLEPIYDFEKLKELVKKYLSSCGNVKVSFNAEVLGGKIEKDGMKTLTVREGKTTHKKKFDFVINCTYGNYNNFSRWFSFPLKPIRIDLVEALIVKLPIPKISLAVMDGPFTNLVPIKNSNTFTLVHIEESIHQRYVPKDGLVKDQKFKQSRAKEIIKKSGEWFPILKEAELIESRNVHRAVNAYREHDDARPSDIYNHGFGCWSILGGKIVNCVDTSREIVEEIFPENKQK